jgi:hypothetical protein
MNPAAWSPWLSNLDAAAYLIVAALVIWLAFFSDRSKGRKRCPKCWYDMNAAPPPGLTCSECGHVCKSTAQLHKARRRWRPVVWGALACLLTFGVSNWTNLRAGAWMNLVPSTLLYFMAEPDYSGPGMPIRLMKHESGIWVVRPPTPPATSLIGNMRTRFNRELGRRHRAGELPEWIWRSIAMDGFVPPADKSRWLHTRSKWPKGQNLILGSEAAFALERLPNVGGLPQFVQLEVPHAARDMGFGSWAPLTKTTNRSLSSEVWYQLFISSLPIGHYRIPLSLTCSQAAGGKNLEIWRSDHIIELEIVESVHDAIALVDDAATNDAVRRCVRMSVTPFAYGPLQGQSSSGKRESITFLPFVADLPVSCGDSPILKNLGVAFGALFLEKGNVVARCDDAVYPSSSSGVVFATGWDKARLTNGQMWTETARQTLTVRVVGRPEAVLPQLGFRFAWAGAFEVPLHDLLSAGPLGPPQLLHGTIQYEDDIVVEPPPSP